MLDSPNREPRARRGPAERQRPINPLAVLNPKQVEIVRWMAEGLSNKEVAAKMNLSEKTVRNYVSEIFGRLGMESRSQVIAAWRRHESK